jgi:hypothetical protein
MGKISKAFALFLTLTIALSCLTLLTVKSANSQTITTPTPSFTINPPTIPEFTVNLAGPSYTYPTTYSLDPNTGQIVAQIGFTNEFSRVQVNVNNQPFTPFTDSQGNPISLMYNVRVKPHNQTAGWMEIYQPYEGYPSFSVGTEQATMDVGFQIQGQMGIGNFSGVQLDIEVQAMIGYVGREITAGGVPYVFVGYTSGWSDSQTVNIPANVPLSASSPSPTLSIPEFPALAIVPFLLSLLVGLFFVAVVLRYRKAKV